MTMTDPAAQRPPSQTEAAYRTLQTEIVACRLAPGERLTERGLAERLGFGLSPIRDALTRLDHDGLIRTLPRKGYQVTPLTPKSVDDLFVVWGIVGPEIARLGVENADADQREDIASAFARLTGPPGGDDDTARQWVDSAWAVFAALAVAGGNDYLVTIFERLQNEIARVWTTLAGADPGFSADDGDWEDILARRDGPAAAAVVRDYVASARRRVMEILSRWPSVVGSEITPLHR